MTQNESTKYSWRRKWQPTPVLLPREFQGHRGLAGYSPWGHKESDTTERLSLFTDIDTGTEINIDHYKGMSREC